MKKFIVMIGWVYQPGREEEHSFLTMWDAQFYADKVRNEKNSMRYVIGIETREEK